MRGVVKITGFAVSGLFALGAITLTAPEAQAQDGAYTIQGGNYGSGIYIDGREPIDRETRDKVDAYLEGYRRRQDSHREWIDRMKSHQSHDLITRSRSQGRY